MPQGASLLQKTTLIKSKKIPKKGKANTYNKL